jgi:hypothetical protein
LEMMNITQFTKSSHFLKAQELIPIGSQYLGPEWFQRYYFRFNDRDLPKQKSIHWLLHITIY